MDFTFGIGSAISGITNAISGGIAARKQRKYDKRESELAYQRQQEMRDNEREYLSPTQQMARLKEGGLNPNLIYGTGSQAASGGAGDQPTYEPAKGTFASQQIPNIGGALNMYQDFRLKEEQINNAKEVNTGINLENNLKMNNIQKQLDEMPHWARQARLKTDSLHQNIEYTKQKARESKANEIFQREKGRLAKLGIFSGDDWRLRAIVTLMQETGITLEGALSQLK